MLIPADTAIARPCWWWGTENPRTKTLDYWPQRIGVSLDLPVDQDAFIDSHGRAVWAYRIRPGHTGPYVCTVIGMPNALCDLVEPGDTPVPALCSRLGGSS